VTKIYFWEEILWQVLCTCVFNGVELHLQWACPLILSTDSYSWTVKRGNLLYIVTQELDVSLVVFKKFWVKIVIETWGFLGPVKSFFYLSCSPVHLAFFTGCLLCKVFSRPQILREIIGAKSTDTFNWNMLGPIRAPNVFRDVKNSLFDFSSCVKS
jgi:hypothetical protein